MSPGPSTASRRRLEAAEDLHRQPGPQRQVVLPAVAPAAAAVALQQEHVVGIEVRADAAAGGGVADHQVVEPRVGHEARSGAAARRRRAGAGSRPGPAASSRARAAPSSRRGGTVRRRATSARRRARPAATRRRRARPAPAARRGSRGRRSRAPRRGRGAAPCASGAAGRTPVRGRPAASAASGVAGRPADPRRSFAVMPELYGAGALESAPSSPGSIAVPGGSLPPRLPTFLRPFSQLPDIGRRPRRSPPP